MEKDSLATIQKEQATGEHIGAETIWKGWTIEEHIGTGGAGDVYKIRRDEYGLVSFAAMKIIEIPRDPREVTELRDNGMSETDIRDYYREMVESLQREIQIMEDLKGAPNVVSIEDYVIREHEQGVGWSIYIRMELLQSVSSYREHTGGLTLEEVLQLGVDICAALEVCRETGITHRDVKPDNIFRSRYGVFKLGDFGIARQMDSVTLRMHTRKGTTTYMAPEVIRRERYDATVDLYSLGLVLYRYLNHNRMPYLPQFPDKIRPEDFGRATTARLAGEPMLPPDQADKELTAIVLQACAYIPDDRYQSPKDLRHDLEHYLYSFRQEHRAPGGSTPKEMYVAYDPQNLQHSYGQDASGLASEETQTMVDPAAGPEVAATGHSPAGLDAPARLMHRAKHAKHKKLARKWQILIAVMLIFCALTGGIIYLQSQFTFVPSVEGMARDDAKAALEKAELTMGIDHKEYSEEIPKGAVISQSPTGGKIQKKHTAIHLVISKGSNKVTVPDLIGRTAEDARETIKSSHLKVNVETTSNILKKSGVVDQSPEAGSRVTRGTTVTITVNESTFRDQVDDWFGTGGDKDDGSVD